ncbi:Outer membrane protein (porin) [Polaromonas sp. OV174]|uniref:porin n=1 Tax=Polaromonas sp. OV174 TaxID=1855300 RepID=UPI0008E63A80|nr:porin [Polaromonas sp. OV174]SFC63465.1 Outer membrane protein (porin) [Polaromonas sp. OV174]
MKRSVLCLAVLCALVGEASAQSNVNLFGIVDAGVRYVKNGTNSMVQVASGGLAASRFGIKGSEDLGGGLAASFWLENQFNSDTGEVSGKFWGRRSTVSLTGGFGEVRLGRDFTPAYRVATLLADPFGNSGMPAIDSIFSTAKINGAAYSTHYRLDNSATYFLPNNLGGVYGQVSWAAPEGVDGSGHAGGLVGYKSGPLDVGGAYGQTKVAQGSVKTSALAGNYDFGVFKLYAGWSQLKYTSASENRYNVGGLIPMGQGTLKVNFAHSIGKGGEYEVDGLTNKANKLAVGYAYDLSKRTSLYTNVAYIKNKGGATFVVGPGPQMDGTVSKGMDFGIKHAF